MDFARAYGTLGWALSKARVSWARRFAVFEGNQEDIHRFGESPLKNHTLIVGLGRLCGNLDFEGVAN